MLNRNSKKFLKFLRNHTPDYANRVYTYDFIEKNYNQQIEKVFATVRFLNSEGYLEIAETSGSGTHFGVILTEKASHPYEFTWEQVKHFLFTSVLVPIVVSIATTLLTLLLQGLLV